ncbi:influenza virus NS1A-binding protein homolog [Oppia nitens]|uniref:influenza virus NS1A-binding protein homolog n=1 Tax=Oppia nitens TaxID=1686743 RepID=UPI0023DC58B0|nr:influenza virus NS1A-binding protein homolog [Oppia nitens]
MVSTTESIRDNDEDQHSPVLLIEDKTYQKSILDNLNMLRKNKQFCDVILQINNKQDIYEIYGHKVVLASASPYLLELFANDQTSSSATTTVNQYKLLAGNYDMEAFECIVDYAYTARLEVPNDKVKDVYGIASRLKMSSIAYECGQYLMSSLTADNCLNIRSIRGVLNDQFLLSSVDNFIRQNMSEIVESKCLDGLQKIQVEVLLNNDEERSAINEKHVFNMVVEWIQQSFAREELNELNICEKMFMLFVNKSDKMLHDCNEIENDTNYYDSDLIQDYKRQSRRLFPAKDAAAARKSSNGHQKPSSNNGSSSQPSKSRQFMFTRSDSESSLSSIADEDVESDWKVLSVCFSAKHTLMGLIIVSGKLSVLIVKLRVSSPVNSPNNSRHHSLEKPELYCLIPPMNSGRCAVGTAIFDGKLFVCGGYDRGECLKTVEVYDELTNKWNKVSPMLVPRGRFGIAAIGTNVYAIGGCDGQNELNSAEMYDSATQEWTPITNCPIVRSNAGVCSLDDKVYVIGGWNGQRGLTRCDTYDPKTNQWEEINPLNTGRYQTGVAVLDGHIYAVGGCDSWTCLNSAEVFANDFWKPIAALHTARRGCGVIAFNGKIYAIGGHDGVHALCSVEIYDPETNQWTSGPSLTNCRANVGVAVVGKRLYAVGGFNGKIFLNTIEFFDSDTNEWTQSVAKCLITDSDDSSHEYNNNNNNNNEHNGKHHHQQQQCCGISMNTNGITGDGYNGCSFNYKTKTSPLNNEPLIEVEETTVGH